MAGPEPGGGLCWSFELDLAGVLAAIDAAGDEDPGDQEASLAAERVAAGSAGVRSRDLTGVIAGQLPAGPGLAAWLANADPGVLSDWDLPGIAAAYRRVASWAAAGELAAVAAIASRTAVRDPRADVDDQGRPDRVTAGAACEVSLALTMSQAGASWWTRLGVELGWRLRDTGAALAAGTIDLARARLIAEAAGPLTDEDAQAVEALVLPGAGGQTTGQLRAALRRAVLRVDPEGAEERRQNAERQATVSLYPDEVGTAALVASHLPGVQAAAMMARLTAIAAGMKASGAGGGIGLLRAVALAGLVLGTLPLTPAPPHGPPDPGPDDPPGPGASGGPGGGDDGAPGGDGGPGDGGLGSPGGGGDGRRPPDLAGDRPSRAGGPGRPPRPGRRPDGESPPGDEPRPPRAGPPGRSQPGPSGSGASGSGASGSGAPDPGPSGSGLPRSSPSCSGASGSGAPDTGPPDTGPPDTGPPETGPPETGPPEGGPQGDGPPGGHLAREAGEAPPLTDADAPSDDDGGACGPAPGPGDRWDDPDGDYDGGILPAWPPLPGTLAEIPPFLGGPPRRHPARTWPGPPAPQDPGGATRRPAGLLDLTISWAALTGDPAAPAALGRLGPVSTAQALPLAVLAIPDPAAQWRVILTNPAGHAIAIERVRRGRLCDNPGRPPGVTGRVTVTIPAATLITAAATSGTGWTGTGRGIRAAVLRAARRAAARAADTAAADADAGGCAHTAATTAYRPATRTREHVTARDQTCRQPCCAQPAWRADLDHTRPWHQGGPTCSCNLGGGCRTHHQIKQLPGWTLTQPRPGTFTWTTPAGRSYTTTPDPYPS